MTARMWSQVIRAIDGRFTITFDERATTVARKHCSQRSMSGNRTAGMFK